MTDPYTEGRHVYTFESTCQESPELKMGDDSVKVFLNASGTLDDVSQNLMEFFNLLKTGRGDTDLCNRIENEVIKAREHNEWRVEFMTLYMRDQENIEKGRAEGIMAMIRLCKKLDLSTDQITQHVCEEFNVAEGEAQKYVNTFLLEEAATH